MKVTHITTSNYQVEVKESEKPVLLDFWAKWCGPCRMLSPVIEKLAEEVPEVKVCKVDIDEQPELAREFQVMSIPTLVVVKDGQIVSQSIGLQSKENIMKMMEE